MWSSSFRPLPPPLWLISSLARGLWPDAAGRLWSGVGGASEGRGRKSGASEGLLSVLRFLPFIASYLPALMADAARRLNPT